MNIIDVVEKYPHKNIKRIDIAIGEKKYLGKGIGTKVINLLVDFAFFQNNVDIIYCFICSYNIRSLKAFEKNGFIYVNSREIKDNPKSKMELHYILTKEGYSKNIKDNKKE